MLLASRLEFFNSMRIWASRYALSLNVSNHSVFNVPSPFLTENVKFWTNSQLLRLNMASGSSQGMPDQSNDYRVAVFGSGGVGKSSIVQRFVKGTFSDNYVPTIEDTYRQVISCNKQQNVCTLHITDTTGSHQFPAMQRLSISKGHAFILVYAIDKEDSFAHLDSIFKEIQAIKGASTDETPIMLVGNKVDESNTSRRVATAMGKAKADKWGAGFIETSAKNNVNIRELFEHLLALEKRRNVTLDDSQEGKKSKKEKKKKSTSPSQTPPSAEKDKEQTAKRKCSLM